MNAWICENDICCLIFTLVMVTVYRKQYCVTKTTFNFYKINIYCWNMEIGAIKIYIYRKIWHIARTEKKTNWGKKPSISWNKTEIRKEPDSWNILAYQESKYYKDILGERKAERGEGGEGNGSEEKPTQRKRRLWYEEHQKMGRIQLGWDTVKRRSEQAVDDNLPAR